MYKMGNKRQKIKNKALELLEKNPKGIRYSELVKRIHEEFQDIPINTICGSVWDIDRKFSEKVYKPARGIFKLFKFKDLGFV